MELAKDQQDFEYKIFSVDSDSPRWRIHGSESFTYRNGYLQGLVSVDSQLSILPHESHQMRRVCRDKTVLEANSKGKGVVSRSLCQFITPPFLSHRVGLHGRLAQNRIPPMKMLHRCGFARRMGYPRFELMLGLGRWPSWRSIGPRVVGTAQIPASHS